MNYYPFHIGDFRSGTANMSRQSRWIYRDMLDVYYDKEKPLPLDIDVLCDLLGVEQEDERRIVERMLRFKFVKTDDGYRHEICDAVIAEYHKKAETARTNGGKGGRPPKNQAAGKTQPDGSDNGTGNNPVGFDPVATGQPIGGGLKTNQEPRTKNQGKPKPPSSSGDDGDGPVKPFDQFWEAYPRKQAKLEAQKAWTSLKLDGKVNEIVQAIEAQKEGHHWRRENGRYIPHPASWLRAGCWLDEVQAYVAPPLKLPPGWWETPEGMKAAGAMLDPPLVPGTGEGQKAFAHRIRVATGQVDEAPPAASMVPPAAAPYIPPAPPPGVELTEEQRQARREETRSALAKMKQAGNLVVAGITDDKAA